MVVGIGISRADQIVVTGRQDLKRFPADELAITARRIAKVPTRRHRRSGESVNQTVDAMGFSAALDGGFKIHQLNHAHRGEVTGRASRPTERSSTAWRTTRRTGGPVKQRP